ncbi:hypothetical protein ACFWDN_15925 [Micromonospora chalcea]
MEVGDVLTITGTNVSAISVIIVYHMFALQSWFSRVEAGRTESTRLSLSTTPDDMERENMRLQLDALARSFPWVQVATLGIAVISMAIVGVSVAMRAHGVPVIAAIFPLCALAGVYLLSSCVTYLKGLRSLSESRRYLG